MNILTFDIEEWYLEKHNHGNRDEYINIYDCYLNEILDLLDQRSFKATFFSVGGMAADFPHILRLIDRRGHEIGCHSYQHTWLNKLHPDDVLNDTHRAVDELEQCIGKKIKSYRAPAFSIGESNCWAFDILVECGIEMDSSVFPAARDFGGFPTFGHNTPVHIDRKGVRIKEFPISTASVLGKNLVFSGGGYFRFFPLWFVKHKMSRSDYTMCYFHLGDLIRDNNKVMTREAYEAYFKEKGSLINRYKRYIKSNLGKKSAYPKLNSIIESEVFINLINANGAINWNSVPVVTL